MPLKPLKQCNHIGCRELTRTTYCPEHIHIVEDKKAERNKYYDNNRDKKYTDFYHSDAWIKIRAIVLRRDNGLCQHCYRNNKVTTADMVHHIVEIKVNWLLRLVLNNLISLCDACHKKIPHKST
ncbi:MAG TPA: HNH endonuclease [Lachnospiraceae bacterium]|nr:HNH endonuclease [Lachnospiraceae bacterium]